MTEQEHLLTCLGEEGAEIAMDCSKCNRFGQHDINVLRPDGPNNIERLVNEMNDLLGVAKMLAHAGVIPENWESEAKQGAKIAKVLKFMKYAREKNALNGPTFFEPLEEVDVPSIDSGKKVWHWANQYFQKGQEIEWKLFQKESPVMKGLITDVKKNHFGRVSYCVGSELVILEDIIRANSPQDIITR